MAQGQQQGQESSGSGRINFSNLRYNRQNKSVSYEGQSISLRDFMNNLNIPETDLRDATTGQTGQRDTESESTRRQ